MKRDLKIHTNHIEPIAVNQIYNLLAQPPFEHSKVRIMPDVHVGNGCVVGFTSTMQDKVIPNVIGVDIGCGMLTVNLGKLEIPFESLDKFIKEHIPAGSRIHKNYADIEIVKQLKCYKEFRDLKKAYCSLGTLGGGNHFIEIDKSEEEEYYLVIHTGSRNLGLQVAKYYQKMAVDACKHATGEEKYRSKIPSEFCYLQGDEMNGYIHDLRICQEYAKVNRREIADKIMKFLGVHRAESFETVHNYIDEDGIIRKGAISAKAGEKLIIPINMKDGCIIGVGKGNADWNCSAPHGAGRLLKRGEVKELFSVDEFKQEMEGIYTSTANESTIDESPMAYRQMGEILSLILPTVEVQKIVKPVYNFKAAKD